MEQQIIEEMKVKIIEELKKATKALSVQELFDLQGLTDTKDLTFLMKALNELEDNLGVRRTNKDNYELFKNSSIKIGTFIANRKAFGFVNVDNETEDIFIAPGNINNAVHGDKVMVEIISKKGERQEGRINKIVNRNLDNMVGEFMRDEKNKGYIQLDDERVKIRVEIDDDKSLSAMPGHKVLVKVTNKLKDNNYKGIVVKVLGHKNDPGVDILSIIAKYGIKDEFSDEVMAEVDAIPTEVLPEEYNGRKDLREEVIFTIDGDDTKDIDDAISIKRLDNGNYVLGVHIADVSHYVQANMKLDEEAYDRGTSVYLADRVIPMLPHKLSNGICSLNPNVDRLAMSCVMEINEKGETVDYDIFESVICSKIQMTYKKVNKVIENNEIPEGYEEYSDALYLMKDLAGILRKMKEKRGYIDFEIDEIKLIIDENGAPTDIIKRERGTGEKIIEDFMIAANETVATHIYFMELPFVYRIHGEPSEEKIQNFLKFIGVLGYKINGRVQEITPHTMQNILDQLKDKKEFHILSNLLLLSMQKAVYDKNNIGHFGLASKCYTHFTSPIRRYPDTTVHRQLRTYLFEGKIDRETTEFWDGRLPLLTEHSSYKERMSVECEREVDAMKSAEYMEQHIGEKYNGIVSSVMSFGMFVQLENLVEGLIRVDELKDDRYIFDETTFSLIGQRTKKIYRMGDKMEVVVKAASKEARTIDFVIAKNEEEETDKKKRK